MVLKNKRTSNNQNYLKMKNLLLVAVIAVTSLTLFSFRNVDNVAVNPEIVDVAEVAIAKKNFVDSSATFPDAFTRWRKEWTDYNSFSQMNDSFDEMNSKLKNF